MKLFTNISLQKTQFINNKEVKELEYWNVCSFKSMVTLWI